MAIVSNNSYLLLFFQTFLQGVVSLIAAPCLKKAGLNSSQVLKHTDKFYWLVKPLSVDKDDPLFQDLPRGMRLGRRKRSLGRSRSSRRRRSANILPGTSLCPWVYKARAEPGTYPAVILEAECPGCSYYCRPLFYRTLVLEKDCDKVTGKEVWKMRERQVTVGFQFGK